MSEDKAPFVDYKNGIRREFYGPWDEVAVRIAIEDDQLNQLIDANHGWLKTLKKLDKNLYAEQKIRIANDLLIEENREKDKIERKRKERIRKVLYEEVSVKDLLKTVWNRVFGS